MTPLIDCKNLSIFHHSTPLIHEVSFQLFAGERVALIGESGCGKSLTAKALMGLLPNNLQQQGTLSFQGAPLPSPGETKWRPFWKKEFAIVFQDPFASLNPTLTCLEQVLEASPNRNKRMAQDVLEEVGLCPNKAKHAYPHQYSGGQRQRILLAIALAKHPSVLICDEPTTSLDVTTQRTILELILRLQDRYQFALLFITHDLAIAQFLCPRTLVMFAGELVEQGLTNDLFSHPTHPYTASLIQSYPKDSLPAIDISKLFQESAKPAGCPYSYRCHYAMNICPKQPPHNEQRCWLYEPEAKERCHRFHHEWMQN